MRVLIDLQACQSPSGRIRGVGRYCLALSQAIARQAGDDEVWIAVNGVMPSSVAYLREVFSEILPDERFLVWESIGPTASMDDENASRSRVAEYLREEFLESVGADVILTMSMIDGYADSVVTSVRPDSSALQVAIVFDLIPFLMPEVYLAREGISAWYGGKLDHLRRCDLLLGISEFTTQETVELLGVDSSRVANVSAAVGEEFRRLDGENLQGVGRKYGIVKPFILYAGGFDPRKNLARLIQAYAYLPADVRKAHQLVFVGGIGSVERDAFAAVRHEYGLEHEDLIITGYVSDEELVRLYNACALYAFPSTHEGFGLPALEAMSCGAVVVGSNTTSLPEVIGEPRALFSPYDVEDISRKLLEGLTDTAFRDAMRAHAVKQVKLFSWQASADAAWTAIRRVFSNPPRKLGYGSCSEGVERSVAVLTSGSPCDGIVRAYASASRVVEVFGLTGQAEGDTAPLPPGWARHPLSSFMPQRFDEIVVDARGEPDTLALLEAVRDTHATIWVGAESLAALGDELVRLDPRLLVQMLYGWGGYAALSWLHRIDALVSVPLEAVAFGSHRWQLRRYDDTRPVGIPVKTLVEGLVRLPGVIHWGPNDITQLAAAMAANTGRRGGLRTLHVDVSNLVMTDARTGIQRVVRHVLEELLANPPPGFRVEPVYVHSQDVYRYARAFTVEHFYPDTALSDDAPVDFKPGDVFLGLDLAAHLIPSHRDAFVRMRSRGVEIHFVVYDLLPLLRSDCFDEVNLPIFRAWYEAIAELADGIVAISRTVADEFKAWLDQSLPERRKPLRLGWFHLGADLSPAQMPASAGSWAVDQLQTLGDRTTFLMVGTIEPRKGHGQALSAFEELWRRNRDVNLVMIGKPGWRVEKLIERLRRHPESGKRLFWFEKAGDELLVAMYGRAAALLAASEGEGFGLPLIEAAQYGMSIIARDLPVFREVAGEHATYFTGFDASKMADVIDVWLDRLETSGNPGSAGMPWMTWKQSAEQLVSVVVDGHWYDRWMSDGSRRFSATDYRAEATVGMLERGVRVASGTPGLLFGSPAFHANQGRYRVIVRGWRETDAGSWLDAQARASHWRIGSWPLGEESNGLLADVLLELQEDVRDLQIRVMTGAGARLGVESIAVIPIS